ncbi:MAG TPA: rhodanese-like domain-containing protein [Phaeodactylibacter sp.]|nr:rhodanese-like domain-containing protein [Phaeodactylibacter sp.]
MKYLKYLFLVISVATVVFSCKDADEIRARAKHSQPVKIVKAVAPNNLGAIKKVSVADFEKMINGNEGILVDVRTPEEYAEGHLKGAVNINFKKRTFPDYINAIDKNKPTLIYCRSGNRSGKAALIMQALGFKKVYDLGKGFKGWKAENKEIVTTDNDANKKLQELLAKGELKGQPVVGKSHQVGVDEFEQLAKGGSVTLVDVRTPKEFAEGHIDGAINVDWKNRHFADNIVKSVSNDKPVAIYCRSGNRATRAMFAMDALGFNEVYNLEHGIKSWKAANKPLKTLEVKGDIRHLDVENFNNAIVGRVGQLIDVRTPREFADAHIPGAINVDYKNANFKANAAKLDKSKPVLIYCRSGARSGRAMKIMEGLGLKVYNLNNGFLDWKAKGMKVEGKNIHVKDGGEEGC